MAEHSEGQQWKVPKRALFRVTVYLVALVGCAFQSDYICHDYFQYPTSTYFSILDSLPTITPPTLTLSFPYEAKIGTPVKDLFDNLKNNITLKSGLKSQVKEVDGKLRVLDGNTVDSYINSSTSYRMDNYQYSLAIKGNWNYTSSVYLDGFPMYGLSLYTNLWWGEGDGILATMTGVYGDLEGDPKTISIPCNRTAPYGYCQVFLTYSIKVTELLPPPFDTKCHNYHRYGFSSRENCFSECLTKFTKRHGMIIESNVILRSRYENSKLILAPWYLRTLKFNGRELIASDIKDSQLSELFPSFKRHWNKCKKTCRFGECVLESLVPHASTPMNRLAPSWLPKEQRILNVLVFPPHNQVIKVSSRPKLEILDLIVYIVCVLSFWFGFYPLQATQGLERKPVRNAMKKISRMTRVINVMKVMKGKTRATRSRRSLIIRILSYLFVTCGFLYEAEHIFDQYFRYPTITSVSMIDAQPHTIPPKITLEFWHPPRTGMIVGDIFNDYPDYSWVPQSVVKKDFRGVVYDGIPKPPKARRKSAFFDVTPFSKMGMYFVTISLRNQSMGFSPEELFTFGEPMYLAVFKTNLINRLHKWASKVKIYVTPRNADMEAIQSSVGISCVECVIHTFIGIYMTYTTKESKLLPPPYDTNCRDYKQTTNLTSKRNCFSECLNTFTIQNGMEIEDSVLIRHKYEKSKLVLVSWKLKDLRGNLSEVLSDNTMSEGLRKKIMNIFPHYEHHWKRCNNLCSHPDCSMQSVIPHVLLMAPDHYQGGLVNRSDTSQFSTLVFRIYPPNDQVIVVESNRKIALIEVIVYALSSLSFWFGFCPFESVKGIKVPSSRKSIESKQVSRKRMQSNRFRFGKLHFYSALCRIFRSFLYVLVLSGFVYQAWGVCQQFFKYETTTHVTMELSSRESVIPKLILPIDHQVLFKDKIGFTVREVFGQIKDQTKLLKVEVRRGSRLQDDKDSIIEFKRYLRLKHYIMSFGPRIPLKYSESGSRKTEPLMKISFQTNVIMKGLMNTVPTSIQSYHSDMEGHQKLPLFLACISGHSDCTIKLTFSTKINKLRPPPYDTNCRDYRTVGKTSRDHCLNSCLNEFTMKHGMFLETSLADRDKLENSSLILIPWELKTMTENGTKLSPSHFLSPKKLRYHRPRGAKVSKEYFLKVVGILPSYETHWSQCKNRCSQANCYTESTLAELISVKYHGHYSEMSNLTFIIYPTKDPVITVTSTAKMNLTDFIVYIFSCLSFWFGFCPVQLTSMEIKRQTKERSLDRSTKEIKIRKTLTRHSKNSKNCSHLQLRE